MNSLRRNINKELGLTARDQRILLAKGFGTSISSLTAAKHKFILAKTIKNLGDISGKRILFVGGGLGREIVDFKCITNNFYALNLEINMKLLQICKNYVKDKGFCCETTAGDAGQLPFKDNSFDIVIFYDSIHHTDNQEKCLKEAARVGTKLCVIDRRKCIISKLGRFFRLIEREQDGFYANEIDMKWLFKVIKNIKNAKITYLKYHFFLLFYINKTLHDYINRSRIFSSVYIVFIKIVNLCFGFLGNGVIFIIKISK